MNGLTRRWQAARRAGWLLDAAVVAAGFVLAGLPGLAVAALGQVGARRYGPGAPAACALGALLVAAIATATRTWSTGSVLFNFPKDHRLAAEAARAAGVFLMVALVGFVQQERTRPNRQHDRGSDQS